MIIEEKKIKAIGVFKTKELSFQDIEGFKVDNNYLYYMPVNKNNKRIKVSTYLGRFGELMAWSEQHFKNLDEEEFVDEEKEILRNKAYGRSVEEREYKFAKAKRTTKIINTISWIVALSTWFYPHFYQIQILLCAILPVIGLIIYKTSKGLIRLDEKPNSAYPNILSTMFLPSLSLAIRALLDISVLDYTNLWQPTTFVIILLGIVIFKGSNDEYRLKKGASYLVLLGIIVFGSMYSYGFLITTNTAFDESEPTIYKVEVLGKRISTGKNSSYYLELSTWGPQKEIEEVSVPKNLYKSIEKGDSAVIYYNKGLYKIPYYMVIQ